MHPMKTHPENHVFGLVDPPATNGILEEVERKGVARREVHVISRDTLAESSAQSGAADVVVEDVTKVVGKLSEEHEFNELYEKQIESGQTLIGIPTSDAIDKEAAQKILHENGGRFINYYGRWVVEELDD